LPGDLQAGRDTIDRIREGLESLQHEAAGEQVFHVTASFGLALLDPDIPAEQCIDRADKALYAAKARGRNRTINHLGRRNERRAQPDRRIRDGRDRSDLWRVSLVWRTVATILFVIWLFGTGTTEPVHADGLRHAVDAYDRGDYVRAVNALSPLALHGNARAQALLGFMYENGFGVPQAYDDAADLYRNAAVQGDPFAQSRLGLIYDKGHGVPQDVILS
jgi:hypothetical protein